VFNEKEKGKMTRFFENYLENKLARLALAFACGLLACAVVWGAAVVAQRQSEEKQQSAGGVWSDRKTGLMWTKQDNGASVNWREAVDYCKALTLEGYAGWRLPDRQEIDSLWDAKSHRLKTGIALTVLDPYLWSANVDGPDYGPGTTYAQVFFPYGMAGIGNMPLERRDTGRALCVRTMR
jgi:hypothetical protein